MDLEITSSVGRIQVLWSYLEKNTFLANLLLWPCLLKPQPAPSWVSMDDIILPYIGIDVKSSKKLILHLTYTCEYVPIADLLWLQPPSSVNTEINFLLHFRAPDRQLSAQQWIYYHLQFCLHDACMLWHLKVIKAAYLVNFYIISHIGLDFIRKMSASLHGRKCIFSFIK